MPSLAAGLDRHPGIWRGSELARTACPGIASGFAALDAELPGDGWPCGALTEILPNCASSARRWPGWPRKANVSPGSPRPTCPTRRRSPPPASAWNAYSSSKPRRTATACGRRSRRCARPHAAPCSPGRATSVFRNCGGCSSRPRTAAASPCCSVPPRPRTSLRPRCCASDSPPLPAGSRCRF